MDKVRADCGGLLNVADKEAKVNPKSIPTWKATHKQLFEDDARQLQAWESCGKRSRKGKKKEELENFLLTVNDYMAARAGVANAAAGYKSRRSSIPVWRCGATADRPTSLGCGATARHCRLLHAPDVHPAHASAAAASRPKAVSS